MTERDAQKALGFLCVMYGKIPIRGEWIYVECISTQHAIKLAEQITSYPILWYVDNSLNSLDGRWQVHHSIQSFLSPDGFKIIVIK